MSKRKIICGILVLFYLFYPVHILALEDCDDEVDYSYIKLNEVLPNPEGSDTDYEWIELYSEAEEEIYLTNCELNGETFPEDVVVGSGDRLVIAKDFLDKDLDGQSFEERWGNGSGEWGDSRDEDFSVVEMNITLGNSEGGAVLICSDYKDSFAWDNAPSGQSFSVDLDGEWTDEYLVTPGRPNEPVPAVVYSHTLLISEIYPSPLTGTDEEEWLELYNLGDEDILLEDWYLEDNSKKQIFDGKFEVKAKSYLVLEGDDLSLTLNNSGEELTLYDPNDEQIDIFEYQQTDIGISNIRRVFNGEYLSDVVQTQLPTKGRENQYINPDDMFYGVELLSISTAKAREIGEEVCIEGTITVEIGKLGSKKFYIQDGQVGIQVYFYKEDFWKDFQIGDRLKLLGELKESNQETRIYIKEAGAIEKVLSGKNISPLVVKTGEVGESVEGSLVVAIGKIVETSGSTFYIDDGSGETKILVKSSTDIDVPKKKKGQYARAVGIVSEYASSGDGSFRILPRYSSDITISDEPLAVTGSNIMQVWIFGAVLLAVIGVMMLFKKRCRLIRIKTDREWFDRLTTR